MAIWFSVLRALPWAAILSNAPAIKRAAEGALGHARTPPGPTPAELQALASRIASIESTQQELSEVLKQMADQTERLTTATEVLAARLRLLTGLAAVATGLAVIALVMIFW